MTTILELIDTTPESTDGRAIRYTHDDGQWRGVFQIADPSAGTDVEWFDLSEYLLGYNLTRGATSYAGRPEACVANIELMADDGLLAPTNPDTSVLFGDHIELGPGLLVRFSLIRVSGGVVVEWLPRFTLKVEDWGDASHARGDIRRHLIVARDTFTSLVDVPVPSADEQDWSDKVVHVTDSADWQYGILAYHDFDLLLPARDEQDSAVRELDAALDPAGLVWFTDRYGHLYIRPRPGDTLHNGSGYTLPTVSFHYLADDDTTGLIAYAVDYSAAEPFGLSKSEIGVKNRVVITSPGGVFDQDDAVSIQRFDPKPYRATWIAENDQAALDILNYRKFAQMVATPLYTCIGYPGFHDLLLADYLYPAEVWHTASAAEEPTSASGVIRRLVEDAIFAGPNVDMSIRTTIDVESFSTVEGLILPVEDLALDAVGDTGAVFSWTNPTQVVTPTQTQVRMIGVTSIWANYPYPITGLSWGGLTPATSYQFQVRLVQIVDGVVTAASSIRLLNFTTTNTETPGTGSGGDIPVPDYTPCDTGWRLQEWNPATDTWDTVTTGTVTGTGPIDVSGDVVPGTIYRLCAREDCSGVFGPWVCGAAWIEPDDWGVPCITPPAFDDAPFDDPDLVAYVPQLCAPAIIREAISGLEAEKGPAFQVVTNDDDGRPHVWSTEEGVILLGFSNLGTLEDDATLSWRGKIGEQPTGVVTLASFAGIELRIQPEGSGFKPSVRVVEQVGGYTTLTSGTELDLDTEYWLNVTHDTTGDNLKLYVGQTLDASALGSVSVRDVDLTGAWSMALPADSWAADVAVFDRVLDPSELPGPAPLGLHATLLSYGPLSLWPINEASGTTLNDEGSLSNDSTSADSSMLGDMTGPDGLPAPVFLGTGATDANGGSAPDQAGYTPGTASGITVVMALRPKLGSGNGVLAVKGADGGTGNTEWEIRYNTTTGVLIAEKTLAGGSTARQRATNARAVFHEVWGLIIVRFPSSTTTGPTIRVNGVAPASSTSGSGTANGNDTGKLQIARRQSSSPSAALAGSMRELAIFAGELADADCEVIEAAAFTEGWIEPTGGDVTTTGGYRYHTFTADDTFNPQGWSLSCDYLVVGGGGGGGGWHRGGGGGGGQVVSGSTTISASQAVTIGAGGTGGGTGSSPGPASTQGGTSSLGSIASAVGGGRGGGGNDAYAAGTGGSGGGGSGVATNSPHAGGSAGSALANAGGQGASGDNAGGGGGGAGSAGVSSATSSNGGAGSEWPSGSGVKYGGGGGGGRFSSFGAGQDGGGNGGGDNTSGAAGTANKGGGGGGAGNFSSSAQSGGAGGTGVVIVRYAYPL